jgi:predicted small secreted protein
MARRLAVVSLIAGLVAAIAGCNTVAGVGKDMKAGGQAIESAADKAKPK